MFIFLFSLLAHKIVFVQTSCCNFTVNPEKNCQIFQSVNFAKKKLFRNSADQKVFLPSTSIYVMHCAIWYNFFISNACNFNKSNTPPRVFSRFLICTKCSKSCKASHIYLYLFFCCKSPIYRFAIINFRTN